MATIYDVNQQELVEKAAEELKKVTAITPPEWAGYVKTGLHKERPPVNNDWWYARVASILQKVYKLGPIGVSKLRAQYGGKHRRGVAPSKFALGSGNIIRKSLQQLEKAGFVKKNEKGIHKGKVITPQGKSFMDRIASEMIKSSGAVKKEEPKPAKPEEKSKPAKQEPKPEKPKSAKPEQKEKPEEKKQEPKPPKQEPKPEKPEPKIEIKEQKKQEPKPAKQEPKPEKPKPKEKEAEKTEKPVEKPKQEPKK